jgi:hypothetical protein
MFLSGAMANISGSDPPKMDFGFLADNKNSAVLTLTTIRLITKGSRGS